MRPKTIIAFERLYIGAILASLLRVLAEWERAPAPASTAFIAGVAFFGLALGVTLVLIVSRLRGQVAKWLLVALFLLGLPSYAPILSGRVFSPVIAWELATGIAQGIALACLFTPSARAWQRGERHLEAERERLGRTFE